MQKGPSPHVKQIIYRQYGFRIVGFEEVDRLVSKAQARADFYTQRLVDYLCNKSNLFPEYLNNSNEDLRPNRDNNNFSSIVL